MGISGEAAPRPSSSGFAERVKDLSDVSDELLERLDYRRSIFERYERDELSIHVHIDYAPVGRLCAIYLPSLNGAEGADGADLPFDASMNHAQVIEVHCGAYRRSRCP